MNNAVQDVAEGANRAALPWRNKLLSNKAQYWRTICFRTIKLYTLRTALSFGYPCLLTEWAEGRVRAPHYGAVTLLAYGAALSWRDDWLCTDTEGLRTGHCRAVQLTLRTAPPWWDDGAQRRNTRYTRTDLVRPATRSIRGRTLWAALAFGNHGSPTRADDNRAVDIPAIWNMHWWGKKCISAVSY